MAIVKITPTIIETTPTFNADKRLSSTICARHPGVPGAF
jgi:hypothetical protein